METSELYHQPVILCNTCDNLLCYEGYVKKRNGINKNLKTNIFEVMFNYSIQELEKTNKIIGIYCSICQNYLGIKFSEKFYICKEMYKCRPYEIDIKVFSLDPECIDFMESSIENARKKIKIGVKIKKEIQLKSKLKTIQPDFDDCDGCILIHKNSGRLLLTDENGIYDHLIKLAYDRCIGNIFLAIYNDEMNNNSSEEDDDIKANIQNNSEIPMPNKPKTTASPTLIKSLFIKQKYLNDSFDNIDDNPIHSISSKKKSKNTSKNDLVLKSSITSNKKPKLFYDSLYNKQKIQTLVNEGKQPFMDQLSKQHRVIDVKQNLNRYQSIYLSNFLHACLYKGQIHEDFQKFNVEQKQYDVKFYKTKVDVLQNIYEDFEDIYKGDKGLIDSLETIIDNAKNELSNSDESICSIF